MAVRDSIPMAQNMPKAAAHGVSSDTRFGWLARLMATRVGSMASALIHGALAVWAGSILFANGSGGGSRGWTSRLMGHTWGLLLLGLVGGALIGVAIHQAIKAYRARFMEKYDATEMNQRQRDLARKVGQTGLAARAAVFALMGWFLISAAMRHEPGQVEGLGGTLSELAAQPHGPWLLGLVSIGLLAYALHCVWLARFQSLPSD